MREVQYHNEDLEPLATLLAEMTGLPLERLAGFAVMLATYEEDGRPSGRLISSTPNMRILAKMLDVAREEVEGELEKLAGLS